MSNKYDELKKQHSKEFNEFPIFFAFDNEQFKKGMKELGLSEKDEDKIGSIGFGGFIRKTDVEAFNESVPDSNNQLNETVSLLRN